MSCFVFWFIFRGFHGTGMNMKACYIFALNFQPVLRLFRSMIPKNLRCKSFGTQSHLRIPITSNFPRMKFNIAQSIEIVKGTFWLDSICFLHWDMFSFFVHSSRWKVCWLQMVLLPKSMDALVSKGGWLIGPEHPLLTGCAPHLTDHFCEVPPWNLKACLIVLQRKNSEWDRL